ncbi:hypothetical protein RhiJN_26370 [Ceratobasidium sp. AG-Ba]|nr:hypothetical protein RhiJN_26370 [Ceratobasidium sp. AG-Ba]
MWKSGMIGLEGAIGTPYSAATRLVNEETGEKIREYAFCGLAVHTDAGDDSRYKMCNSWSRDNFIIWEVENGEDPDEELELSEFDY